MLFKMGTSCISDSMYKSFFGSIVFFCFLGCSNKPDIQGEITQIMQRQTDAWNARDIDGFMQPYWHNDSLRFMGKSGVTLGWNATLNRYKKNYKPEDMGTLKFTNLHFDPIKGENAWVDGRWTLYRSNDTLSGYFTLLWKRIDNNWQIVADHSS